MLKNSFIHLPGIGPTTEERFWAMGIRTWQDLNDNAAEVLGAKRAESVRLALLECEEAVAERRFHHFHGRLASVDMWRLLPALFDHELHNDIAYLDIETTGLGFPPTCESTTIAVWYNGELHLEHTRERKRALVQELDRHARMLVTFNGGTFDLPFLRREFGVDLVNPHLDLRFWLAKLGFRGGLKKVQQQLPVRARDSMDIDGYDAVRLWRLHLRGVPGALDTLFTYNAEDTVVLEPLAHCGLSLELERRAFLGLNGYEARTAPKIPYEVFPEVYRMLRG